MKSKKLELEALDRKLDSFKVIDPGNRPDIGWLKAIRLTLGMTLQQLAKKLSITKQSVREIEIRERNGNITLNSLKQVATALDMKLVYGFVPIDGSLEALIEKKAKALAYEIVSRANTTMILEDQQIPYERLQKSIDQRTQQFKDEIPKVLWD